MHFSSDLLRLKWSLPIIVFLATIAFVIWRFSIHFENLAARSREQSDRLSQMQNPDTDGDGVFTLGNGKNRFDNLSSNRINRLESKFSSVSLPMEFDSSCEKVPSVRSLSKTSEAVILPLQGDQKYPQNVHVVQWALYVMVNGVSTKLVAQWQGDVPATYKIIGEKYTSELERDGDYSLDGEGGLVGGWSQTARAL